MTEDTQDWREVEAFSGRGGSHEVLDLVAEVLEESDLPVRRFESEGRGRARAILVEGSSLEALGRGRSSPLRISGAEPGRLGAARLVLISGPGARADRVSEAAGLATGSLEVLVGFVGAAGRGASDEGAAAPEPAATLTIRGARATVPLHPLPGSGAGKKPRPRITPLGRKIPEHPDGLAKRSDWFRKRRG